MNELMSFQENEIIVAPGSIEFKGFERLKGEALQLAQQIEQVAVTEDNVAESKKLLAAVNKRVKEIDDKRIKIKKEILDPYTTFEKQVKEITTLVKDSNDLVRDQVRGLEEQARDEKEVAITELFNKRLKQYEFPEAYNETFFIRNEHLNKSKTMKSIEEEMVEWFTATENDLNVIYTLPNSTEVLNEYLDTKNLAVAMKIVTDRIVRQQELEEQRKQREQARAKTVTTVEKALHFITLTDDKDLQLVKMFMDQNNINYTYEKGNN